MVEVTRVKAKELFHRGKTIIVLPSAINPLNTSFLRLYIHQHFYKQEFPIHRIDEYHGHYCNEANGQTVKYYYDAPHVFVSWNGNGFLIRDAATRSVLYRGKGKEGTLIRYLNANCLLVRNAGLLQPKFRSKIRSAQAT